MADIRSIVMPKWGLSMEEGTLAKWLVPEGATISEGQEIMDIETSKIANVYESPVEGTLRKRVAQDGDLLAVGSLLGVVADTSIPDSEIESFIADFTEKFGTGVKEGGTAPKPVTVEIEGQKIRYLKLGEGDATPVLFIHGFGSDHTSWLFNHEAAAAGRTAYALDLPGHGQSSKSVRQGTIEELAALVSKLIDHLGLEKLHLVGHSLGAAVATLVASSTPQLVASLSLIAPAGVSATISGEFLDGFLRETRGRKLRPVLEMLVSNPALVTNDMVEEVLKAKRIDGAEAALQSIRSASFEGGQQKISVLEKLANLKCPVSIIVGNDDKVIPSAADAKFPAAVTKILIQGAGHIPHMEKAADVNAALNAAWN